MEKQEMMRLIEVGLSAADNRVQENKDWLWFLSFWVGVTMSLTLISAAGVVIAICKDSKQQEAPCTKAENGKKNAHQPSLFVTRSQFMLSWVVLPALVLFTLVGWCLLIASSLSTVIATDVCMAGALGGTPEKTLCQMIGAWGMDADADRDAIYESIMTYTTEGCQGDDPIQDLRLLENLVEQNLMLLQKRIDEAYDVGIDKVKEQCGKGNHIDTFLEGIHNLVWHMELVRGSLAKVTAALECPNINSIYSRSIHGVLCTDIAAASASAFVLLFLVSLASMVLITLRASWRHSSV